MIFAAYPRVAVKLGDERYEFDRASLMFAEVVEIETVSGLSYGEWVTGLSRYSIRSVAALLHVLRRRAGIASNFAQINFAVDDLDVVPLHEDGTEFTAAEVSEDITKRLEAPDPTSGTDAPVVSDPPPTPVTSDTSLTSPASTTSAPGNGNGSRGGTSRSSRRTPTRA